MYSWGAANKRLQSTSGAGERQTLGGQSAGDD
jgi:hypothetical protein